MFGNSKNKQKVVVQASGYNNSQPTRVCPHCGKEKSLSEFGFRRMKPKDGAEIRNQSWCKSCRSHSW